LLRFSPSIDDVGNDASLATEASHRHSVDWQCGPPWARAGDFIDESGRWLAAANTKANAQICDLTAAKISLQLNHPGRVMSVAFGPGRSYFATGGVDETTIIWVVGPDGSPKVEARLEHQARVNKVAISPNGRWLITKTAKGLDTLWNIEDLARPFIAKVINIGPGRPDFVAFTHDSGWLVTGGRGNEVHLWNLKTDSRDIDVTTLEHDSTVRVARFNSTGEWLLTRPYRNSLLYFWHMQDTNSPPVLVKSVTTDGGVAGTYFDKSGRWLVTMGKDKTLRLWDLESDDVLSSSRIVLNGDDSIRAFAVSPGAEWLATLDADGFVRLWPLSDERLLNWAQRQAGRALTEKERQVYGITALSSTTF
jgi:WD40 repeat protein